MVDASHPDPGAQLATVRDVLSEVGARDIPEIIVFNKCDLIDAGTSLQLRGLAPGAVFVSAQTGEGLDLLMAAIDAALPKPSIALTLKIPFDRGDVIAMLHDEGMVKHSDYGEEGTLVTALVDDRVAALVSEWVIF